MGLGAIARKRAVMTTVLAALLMGGTPISVVHAQSAPDPSDVVIDRLSPGATRKLRPGKRSAIEHPLAECKC